MDGTRTRLICIHGHLVPNGLLRGCALSTSQFLRGDTLAVISFPPPLGFFFFFFIGCTVNAWADYCCKRWKQHKTVVSLGPFSLCPSHSSLTRVNHYISFSDSLYLLCIDIHMQGNKNACFFLFLKELVSCCLYCYANFISSLNDISWVFAMTLLKEYHIMILV